MPGSQIFGKWNAKTPGFTLQKMCRVNKSEGNKKHWSRGLAYPDANLSNSNVWYGYPFRWIRSKVYFANRLRRAFESTKLYFGAREGTVEGFVWHFVRRIMRVKDALNPGIVNERSSWLTISIKPLNVQILVFGDVHLLVFGANISKCICTIGCRWAVFVCFLWGRVCYR